MFVDADADGSGRLDFEEFKDVVMKIDPEISSTRISHMFRQLVSRETFSPLPIPAANAMCLCVGARGYASVDTCVCVYEPTWQFVYRCAKTVMTMILSTQKPFVT